MSKPSYVKKDEQAIRKLRECLMDMWGIREIRHSTDTPTAESEADPFAALRALLDRSVVCEGGKPYRGEK